MISTLTVLALAFAAQAAPAPSSEVTGPTSFSVDAVPNPTFNRNGTAAMLKAYAKHGLKPTKPMPAAWLSELQRRQDGSAPANPDSDDVEYLVSTSIGTPAQKLNLDFDTGSADLWVFSTSLSTTSQRGHNIFSPSKSSTFKTLSGSTWDISYADGSGASGTVGTDTVKIGATVVKTQAVELANRVSSTFVSDASDGLVGLAFSSINTVYPRQQSTFFANAVSSLDSPLFAAYLPKAATGAYDFGATNSARYSGSIVYTAVDSSNGFWEFPSTSYKVGSTVHSQAGYTGIADTGTTLLLMGDDAVDTYYASVSGAEYDSQQGGYTFPCSATLPSISVRIGPTNYASIPGKYINFAAISSTTCFGGLQSVGGGSMAIYGDIFFNGNYVVFSSSGPKIGFAPTK